MLAVLAAALVSAVELDIHPRERFEAMFYDHMQKFELKFPNAAEFIKRLSIFIKNVETIEAHNADKTQTYQLGPNQFTHMTLEEWRDYLHLGSVRPPVLRRNPDKVLSAPADLSTLPASVNWVTAGAVTPVKNQGQCGSCWSFSTTGSLEGAYFLKNKNLVSFSEQELVSCDTTDKGCNGGWMDDAFTWIKGNGGITTEAQYPYTSGTTMQSGSCSGTGNSVANSAPSGYVDVTPNDVNALAAAVAITPVSIAIQANQPAFQSYKSGVLTGKCGQQLDHGVLAVGYGTENGVDYWLIKVRQPSPAFFNIFLSFPSLLPSSLTRSHHRMPLPLSLPLSLISSTHTELVGHELGRQRLHQDREELG